MSVWYTLPTVFSSVSLDVSLDVFEKLKKTEKLVHISADSWIQDYKQELKEQKDKDPKTIFGWALKGIQ